jgi:CRP-like cAMP-binding protein
MSAQGRAMNTPDFMPTGRLARLRRTVHQWCRGRQALPADHGPAVLRAGLHEQHAALLAAALRRLGGNCSLGADDIALLARRMRVRRFTADQSLAPPSAPRALMLLLDGEVTIRVERPPQPPLVAAVLGPGTLLSELNLFHDAQPDAVCAAAGDVQVAELPAAAIEALVHEHPAVAARLMWTVGHGLSRRLQAANDRLRVPYQLMRTLKLQPSVAAAQRA